MGVRFAVVHFYWAAGGTARNNAGAIDAAAQAYIGLIAVIGVVSAAVAHGFAHDWAAPQPRAGHASGRVGGAPLVLGVLVGVGR